MTYSQDYPGLPTRSQHPLLQSYFIPAIPVTSDRKWSYSQSLYITNTYQLEDYRQEEVEIDVENTRLDFQITYYSKPWYFNVNIPYINNKSGFMDETINHWHEFFYLPKGGRDKAEDNQIGLFYKNEDRTFFDIDQPTEGLADVQLALGYQIDNSTQAWIGLEIPSSNDSALISNDAIDTAIWISKSAIPFDYFTGYFTLGLAFPANEGLFKNDLRKQIGFAQFGIDYSINADYELVFQADFHTEMLKKTNLEALSNSLQGQFVLRCNHLIPHHTVDFFFSEDIYSGHAPDITFSMRISSASNNK